MTFLGIDNGVTGTIGVANESGRCVDFFKTPVKATKNYQKSGKNITRVNVKLLRVKLEKYQVPIMACIERPLNNPRMYSASLSAMRALEATLIVLEELNIPYVFIDSKQWQGDLLLGSKGSDNLKKASREKGIELHPEANDVPHPDCDGLLIACWYSTNYTNLT